MHTTKPKAISWLLGGAVALALVALAGSAGAGSSGAQQDAMQNCPQPGKWAISVWSGDDDTDTGQALATCGQGAVDLAYYIDPESQQWLRYFVGRAEVSNLLTLDDMQGVLARGTIGLQPTPTPTPAGTPTATPTEETGYLPPPQEVGHVSAGGDAVVTTSNDTPYTLTLEFEGPTSQTVTIARCDTCHVYSFVGPIFCPSERPEGTITLPPGTYQVTARVDDPSVIPFAGDWTLDADTEYFHCFYIVTTFG